MKEEFLQIKDLLERFFEGQTNNDEEQTLYDFFSRDDLPDEWIRYKPVMKYFESGLADEIGMGDETGYTDESAYSDESGLIEQNRHADESGHAGKIVELTPHPASQALFSIRKHWITWCGVAASILLILFTTLYLFTDNDPVDPFAGSYIIRNGVRITDLDLIRPELEAAVQKGMKMDQETDRLFEQLSQYDDNQEIEIIKQMREHNNRILDNIRDEDVRKEVEEIINTQF